MTQPPRRTRRISPIALILILVLVALIGGAVGSYLWLGTDSPERAVRRYFDAMGPGHTPSDLAKQVTNPPTPQELSVAASIYPTVRPDYKVLGVSMQGTRAVVKFSDAGRSQQVELETRHDGSGYKVVDGFPSLQLTSPAGLVVGTGKFPAPMMRTPILPGTYRIGVLKDASSRQSLYLDLIAENAIEVRPGEHKQQDVPVKLNETGLSAARSAVTQAFIGCLGTEVAPAGCPFAIPAPSDVDPRSAGTNRWRMADSSSVSRITDNAEVDPAPSLEAVCVHFEAQVFYSYYGAGGRKQVPAPQNRYTACVNLADPKPTVTWKQ